MKGVFMNRISRRDLVRSGLLFAGLIPMGVLGVGGSLFPTFALADEELSDSARIAEIDTRYQPGDLLTEEDVALLARNGIVFDEAEVQPYSIVTPFNKSFSATKLSSNGIHTKLWGNVFLEDKGGSEIEFGGHVNAGSLEAGFWLITINVKLTMYGLAVGDDGNLKPSFVGSAEANSSKLNSTDFFTADLRERGTVVLGATPVITVYAELDPMSGGTYRIYDDDHDFDSWL